MEIKGKIIVVTGAANGIGAALARRFALAGAEALLLCDLDSDGARDVAADLDLPEDRRAGGGCDVADREGGQRLVAMALARFGRNDLFWSNDRKHAWYGKSVCGRLDLWGRRVINKK